MRDWLIEIRQSQNLKQKAVASSAKISQPAYCNIESGKRNPAINTAKKIADVLGFNWERFYSDN